jgi:hypothetical protein
MRAHPDSHAAGDFSAPNPFSQSFGEKHGPYRSKRSARIKSAMGASVVW